MPFSLSRKLKNVFFSYAAFAKFFASLSLTVLPFKVSGVKCLSLEYANFKDVCEEVGRFSKTF